MERFAPVYSGFDWWVVDRQTQSWTKCPNQDAAIEKAEYNNYVWGETVSGKDRFRSDP